MKMIETPARRGTPPMARGEIYGFVHLRFDPAKPEVSFIGARGSAKVGSFKVVRAFTRELATGEIEITAAPKPQITKL